MANELAHRGSDGSSRALAQLPVEEWTVLHAVAVPGRRRVVADHVVIGPPGVFAVTLASSARPMAVAHAADSAARLGAAVGVVRRDGVHPMLCLVTDEPVDAWSNGVVVCSPATMVELLAARRAVLEPAEVRDAALELDASTGSRTGPRTARHRREGRRGAR